MLAQSNPGTEPGDPIHLEQALLGLLVHDHSGLWSLAELNRSLTPSAGDTSDRAAVEDAIEDLYAAGLIHRIGDYVFATRAAHEAQRLAG